MTDQPKKESNKPKSAVNDYLKYSQLGVELFITIGLSGFIGYQMDKWWNNGKPLWVLVMIGVGAIGAFYRLYKNLPKDE